MSGPIVRPSTDRNGARWTLYGLPGGHMTAAPVGEPLTGSQAVCAVPLLTFRGGPGVTADRYSRAILPRLNYARGWALVCREVTATVSSPLWGLVEIKTWPTRAAMARRIRADERTAPSSDWRPIVRLAITEGY